MQLSLEKTHFILLWSSYSWVLCYRTNTQGNHMPLLHGVLKGMWDKFYRSLVETHSNCINLCLEYVTVHCFGHLRSKRDGSHMPAGPWSGPSYSCLSYFSISQHSRSLDVEQEYFCVAKTHSIAHLALWLHCQKGHAKDPPLRP